MAKFQTVSSKALRVMDKNILYNVCAAPWGRAILWGVKYHGGYNEYLGGYLEYHGGCSVP